MDLQEEIIDDGLDWDWVEVVKYETIPSPKESGYP